MSLSLRVVVAGLVVLGIAAGAWALLQGGPEGRALTFALLSGAAFGVVLQRSRFCFYCNLRDLVEKRDAAGVLAILIALAVGAIGYVAIFGAWVPTPQPGRLPPTAHVGPVSLLLPIASFVFGIGMAVSGSCLSAHFYRLGEGSPVAPFAIIGAGIGFGVGFFTWNDLYFALASSAPSIWLPHHVGYAGSMAITLGGVALLALIALWWARPQPVDAPQPATLKGVMHNVFIRRWPASFAGVAVGLISTLYYFRVAPLGVTAELGSIVRTAAANFDLLPATLHGLDALRGCATVIKEALLSNNGLFVIGIIAAAFASALIANQFTPRWPRPRDMFRGLAGGVLLGWGAMTALGCTVGVLLSGIHAGAVSGWVFLAACALGAVVFMPLGRRLQGA
jgi:uncharacterized membrane protein YedE/YeeE